MEQLFDEVKHQSRSRQIVDKFRAALEEGSLRVGDKLPPERELCVQLGVSRTSLREAVRILDAYGVVEATQGGGTFITDRFTENIFEFLGFDDLLSRDNLRHLLQARSAMETGAVEQALETADDGALRKLELLVRRLETEEDPALLGGLDAEFHETLVLLSGNPILMAVYRMIHKIVLQGTSRVIAYPGARETAVRDHRRILEALKRKDRRECSAAVRRHLKHTEKLIEKYFEKEG